MGAKAGDICKKCNKAVAALSEGYGLSSGEIYHVACFTCSHCRLPIDGPFAQEDEGRKLFHPKCRSLAMGDVCSRCSKPIEDSVLSFKGAKFHSACFSCASCSTPLSGKPFSDLNGRLLCSPCSTAAQLQNTSLSSSSSSSSSSAPPSSIPEEAAAAARSVATASTSSSHSSTVPKVDPETLVDCESCKLTLKPTEETVMLQSNKGYHLACFVCSSCAKPFPDMKFSQAEGKIFHKECLQAKTAPKCAKCAKPLLAGYIPYKDKHLHPECFQCTSCATPLSGKSFGENAGGEPFCSPCMDKQQVSAPAPVGQRKEGTVKLFCSKCKQPVEEGLSIPRGRIVHRECFVCGHCALPLQAHSLAEKNDVFYHQECFEAMTADSCAKCGQLLLGGHVPYRGRNFHEQCLSCSVCNSSLIGVKFTEEDGIFFCRQCAPPPKTVETERVSSYNPYQGASTNPESHEPKGLGTHDRCPRCNTKVFMNDQIVGPRATLWHRKCLYCEECHKFTDSGAILVGNIPYCKVHGRGK